MSPRRRIALPPPTLHVHIFINLYILHIFPVFISIVGTIVGEYWSHAEPILSS